MAGLTSKTIANTYDSLLKTLADGGITTSLQVIEDGVGDDTCLQLSTKQFLVKSATDIDATFDVQNSSGHNLYIDPTNDRIGIGTATPISQLEVRSPNNDYGGILSLTNANGNIGNTNVLGRINFSAPVEGSGTDAIVVAASIVAVAQDTFAADNNSTALHFQTGASEVATTKMVIDEDGLVGIGTASPASQLHAAKAGANCELTIACHSDTEAHAPYVTFKKSDNTEASPALVDDDDILGGLSFQGYTNAWVEGAAIKAVVSGTPSTGSNDLPSELIFLTCPDGSGAAT